MIQSRPMITSGQLRPVASDSQMARLHDFEMSLAACRRHCYERDDLVGLKQMAKRAAALPAPGYYVEYDYARRHVGRIIREWERAGRIESRHGENRRSRGAMMEEIARRTMATMGYLSNLNLGEALSRVLAEGDASSYFISDSYAEKLMTMARGGRLQRVGRLRRRRLL